MAVPFVHIILDLKSLRGESSVNFRGNSAKEGGSITAQYTYVVFYEDTDILFTNNSANLKMGRNHF